MFEPIIYWSDLSTPPPALKKRHDPISIFVDTFRTNQSGPDDKNIKYKIYIQFEPPAIVSSTPLIRNHKQFDLILCTDPEILNMCDNAKRYVCGGCWIDFHNLKLEKQEEISLLISSKSWTSGHLFRHMVWEHLAHKTKIDKFKTNFIKSPWGGQPDAKMIPDAKDRIWKNAMFSICMENSRCENFMTERVMEAFLTKTFPIYYGAPNIGEFFNTEGLFQFKTIGELDKILNNLSPELYYESIDAINDNYNRALEFKTYLIGSLHGDNPNKRLEKEIDLFLASKN